MKLSHSGPRGFVHVHISYITGQSVVLSARRDLKGRSVSTFCCLNYDLTFAHAADVRSATK